MKANLLSPPPANPLAVSLRLRHLNAAKTRFQLKHDLRIGRQPRYVDGTRSEFNVYFSASSLSDYRNTALMRRSQTNPVRGPQLTKMAITAAGLITLGHLLQGEFDALEPDVQHDAFFQIAQAVADRLENEVTHFALHRDETALHAHFMMPARRRGDCRLMSEVLSPTVMCELQDIAFQVTQRFTPAVQRGTPARLSHFRNLSVRELHRKQAEDIAKREARLQDLFDEIAAREARVVELAELSLKESIASARRALTGYNQAARVSARVNLTKTELKDLKQAAEVLVSRFASEGLAEARVALAAARQKLEMPEAEMFTPAAWRLLSNVETLREVKRQASQDPRHKAHDQLSRLDGCLRTELHTLYSSEVSAFKAALTALFSQGSPRELSDATAYMKALEVERERWSHAALTMDHYLAGVPAPLEAAALSELLELLPSYADFVSDMKSRLALDEARYALAEQLAALPIGGAAST